jgi:wyosine [tRNA(Phe)-imidazoG37] synthetase (radical SAM superfamily)
MIYLVQYDRTKAKLVRLQEFPAADKLRAESVRLSLELDLLKANEPQEVVLLEASNEKELRKTHRRYFEKLEQLMEDNSVPSE